MCCGVESVPTSCCRASVASRSRRRSSSSSCTPQPHTQSHRHRTSASHTRSTQAPESSATCTLYTMPQGLMSCLVGVGESCVVPVPLGPCLAQLLLHPAQVLTLAVQQRLHTYTPTHRARGTHAFSLVIWIRRLQLWSRSEVMRRMLAYLVVCVGLCLVLPPPLLAQPQCLMGTLQLRPTQSSTHTEKEGHSHTKTRRGIRHTGSAVVGLRITRVMADRPVAGVGGWRGADLRTSTTASIRRPSSATASRTRRSKPSSTFIKARAA